MTPAPLWGLVGQGNTWEPLDPAALAAAYAVGVRLRLVEADWADVQPDGPTAWRPAPLAALQGRIDTMAAAGPGVVFALDLGVQYPPAWATALDPLVDQAGTVWRAAPSTGGGVNVYWSPTVRSAVAAWVAYLFAQLDFHGALWAVRVGPFMGELLYPPSRTNPPGAESFWAFDATAQAGCPVPGWRPGDPTPRGEAHKFYRWYVANLAGTFTWFLGEIRRGFAGYVAPVTPGLGLWPAAVAELVAGGLADPRLHHTGTGNAWYRLFDLLGPDPAILHWCSSVGDQPTAQETSPRWWEWSSAHALARLAHHYGRPILAENPDRTPPDRLAAIRAAVTRYGYTGLIWVREANLTNPACVSWAQWTAAIGGVA